MKWKNLVGMMIFVSIFLPICGFAEDATEEWVKKYGSGYSYWDLVGGMVLDSLGSVYVTGEGYKNNWTSDYATIKYDTNGNELWVKGIAGGFYDWTKPFTSAIAKDSLGNVYVIGSAYTSGIPDYITVKYDTNGNELWVKKYDSGGLDCVSAITVDLLNNIYVTGSTATIKYDTNGNELWVAKYNRTTCQQNHITVDSSGNVYVTGYGGTISYDTNGKERWVSITEGNAIALDISGNIYITGGITGTTGFKTIKYDTNGNELWTKSHNGGDLLWTNYPSILAVDSSGNVYVTGTGVTVKYDTNGNELWVERWDGFAHAIKVDSSGNIYVTGTLYIGNSGNLYATKKYDTNGNELWLKTYGCGWGAAIAIDSYNSLYVTGGSLGATDSDYATIKYKGVIGIPKAPSNLTATAISQSQINLSWADNSDNENGFKIVRATVSGGPYTLIATLPANSTTYQDTGLLPGTTYYYKVKAFNAKGDSGYAVAGYVGCDVIYEASVTTLNYNACNLTDVIRSIGIGNKGIETGLVSLAENACRQITNGKTIPGRNILEAIIKEILAQKGKNIDNVSADKLINYINNVIAAL